MIFSSGVRSRLLSCARTFAAGCAMLVIAAPLAFAQQAGSAAPIPAVNVSTPEDHHDLASENEKARLAVNPVTGVATSSGAGYEPLTGKERWKLYWKQNYLSMGAYFGPLFTALVLDQA